MSVSSGTVPAMKRWTPRARLIANQLMWGNLITASPIMRELADKVREERSAGVDEQVVIERLRSRLQSEGLTTRSALAPNLTRKMLRVRLRPLLHALVDLFMSKTKHRRLGEALSSFLDRVGWDSYIEQAVLEYASTGHALPVHELFAGKVLTHDFGMRGEHWPCIVLVATPSSDLNALKAELDAQAAATFPAASLGKKYPVARLKGAEYVLKHAEDRTYAEIAHEEVQEERPSLLTSDDDEEFMSYEGLVETRRKTIEKAARRVLDHGDRILDIPSPGDS